MKEVKCKFIKTFKRTCILTRKWGVVHTRPIKGVKQRPLSSPLTH